MHCPRCGQQQVSSETKFCSRCGFQLGLVAELLNNGGTIPALAAIEQKRTIFNKKNGVGFSILWLIFFVFLAIFWEIINADPLSEISVAMGIFGFLAFLIGSLVMLPSSKQSRVLASQASSVSPTNLAGSHASPGLPPAQQEPAGFYSAPQGAWRTPDTGELVERGSVIENTTKLLKQDEK